MSHFVNLVSLGKPEEEVNLEGWAYTCISDKMEPFCECTEDKRYLEFYDTTEDVKVGYLSDKFDCFRLPNGSIVPYYHKSVKGFVIIDGVVYQRCAGRLKHAKRTKKARKLKALPDYPLMKFYSTEEEYAAEYLCYWYDEEQKAYGYWSNPNAFWDWYQIGGRWPFMFLVKEDCTNVILGSRSWATEKAVRLAPQGYKWVAGARKQDIEWELMKSIGIESATKTFHKLEAAFRTGVLPKEYDLHEITDNGIVSFGNSSYIKDETLEQYLERYEFAPDNEYPISPYSFLKDGEYSSNGNMGWFGISSNDKPYDEWRQIVQEFVASIPNEDYIVTVDCHI